jgi:sortase A
VTATLRRTPVPSGDEDPAGAARDERPGPTSAASTARRRTRSLAVVAGAWVVLAAVGVVAVVLLVGAFSEQRAQSQLLTDYRVRLEAAANAAFGLPGVAEVTNAPARGEAVAVLDIAALGLRRVVVEGTGAAETEVGPGHVVGTAAPGQPGNAVVVGRRQLHGGAFADLDRLEKGDEIVVTTEQGRSVYEVAEMAERRLVAGDGASGIDEVYGPSDDDRLTLLTSASTNPWNADAAFVVVAELRGEPFGPTPQGGRTPGDDGRSGSSPLSAAVLLAVLAYGAAVAGAVWLFRTVSWRAAYVLSIPLVVAATILVAEQLARTAPSWA